MFLIEFMGMDLEKPMWPIMEPGMGLLYLEFVDLGKMAYQALGLTSMEQVERLLRSYPNSSI